MNFLQEDKVVNKAVGLRPARSSIRIEKEEKTHHGNRKWASHILQQHSIVNKINVDHEKETIVFAKLS